MRAKLKTWVIRLLLGLLILLAVAYLVRSSLLPARTAACFWTTQKGRIGFRRRRTRFSKTATSNLPVMIRCK